MNAPYWHMRAQFAPANCVLYVSCVIAYKLIRRCSRTDYSVLYVMYIFEMTESCAVSVRLETLLFPILISGLVTHATFTTNANIYNKCKHINLWSSIIWCEDYEWLKVNGSVYIEVSHKTLWWHPLFLKCYE